MRDGPALKTIMGGSSARKCSQDGFGWSWDGQQTVVLFVVLFSLFDEKAPKPRNRLAAMNLSVLALP